VHRIGRTARAGSTGKAISLVSPDETTYLRDIVRLLGRDLPTLPLPAFEMKETPQASLPAQAQAHGQAPQARRAPPQRHRPQPQHRGGGRGHSQGASAGTWSRSSARAK
jgi:ATP-dependent RNA helicase RhlE